ncbi:MAG: hypothetical protein WED10_01645 [Brumimicrobium sp.]
MKKNLLKTFGIASVLFAFTACGESTDVVESGTYEGKIKKVEAEKSEIYVETSDDKTLELYFTDETKLTKAGETVEFSVLEKGQKVEVEVEKVGKRLDPLTVKIME